MVLHLPSNYRVLRILKSGNQGSVLITLSGRLEETDLLELQRIVEAEANTVDLTIDLKEVRLVCREALPILAAWEALGIKLHNCPPYVRESLDTGRYKSHEP